MHGSREWLHNRFHRDKRHHPEMPVRAMAQKHQVSPNTVAKALQLEELDVGTNTGVVPAPIGELRNPDWVREGHPQVLPIGIGTAVAESGLTARFTTTSALVNEFTEVHVANHPFSEWDRTFTDPRPWAAIAERLTFKGTLIQTGPDFYRLKMTEYKCWSARRS